MQEIPRRKESCNTFDLAAFSRKVVIQGIHQAKFNKPEMKHRIMLARQCGFLSDVEVERWIRAYGLSEA